MPIPEIDLSEYNYSLPPERIALFPLEQRDTSFLLIYSKGKIQKAYFWQLPEFLPSNALLVFNNTKVIPVRLRFTTRQGQNIEVFCLEPENQAFAAALASRQSVIWKALVGNAKKWKSSETLKLENKNLQLQATCLGRQENIFRVRLEWNPSEFCLYQVFEQVGYVPLPPYIKRAEEDWDKERYQTIYAKELGSVAAPTAGLHFTPSVFDALVTKGILCEEITLHVGAGTFLPVTAARIEDHVMHSEYFYVSKGVLEKFLHPERPVIAVGTTVMRTLESVYQLGCLLQEQNLSPYDLIIPQWLGYESIWALPKEKALNNVLRWIQMHNLEGVGGKTHLIIVPGYHFGICQGLVTNFHQPQSTLLLLVAAFIGSDWKAVYEYALANEFRFLSYGDSSLLWRF
ncbi:MAG: S-adenosylmethionine:tRNA ribosyltransferase-isomerase [Bacteroidia bacterium]|nr:S-adenosylmethionine:tRNA ribosyltransferase-isomerase [Bacteroidia bacterium]MDW8158353.1 S-adenosylmethionine:tRNA ribosyltransferase-isomerase [Bacteroidia bacterium]